MQTLKLISLNIEGHRHLEKRVLPFLQTQQPAAVCLQEVFEVDVAHIEKTLGIRGKYVPMANVNQVSRHMANALGNWGLYIGSRWPIQSSGFDFYKGQSGQVPVFFENNDPNSPNRAVLWAQVSLGENQGRQRSQGIDSFANSDQSLVIATTHFTWSKNGQTTSVQHRDLDRLLAITRQLPPHILCGDFNAPRGREIFSRLATAYHDNIPLDITTTLDGKLHKAAPLEYVVDGMFSHPDYEVSQVQIVGGVSDHMALVAQVKKVT